MENSEAKLSGNENPPTILVVDDNYDHGKLAKVILTRRGEVNVILATSVQEALGQIGTDEKKWPRAVLCDYQLPRENGKVLYDQLPSKLQARFGLFTAQKLDKSDPFLDEMRQKGGQLFEKNGSVTATILAFRDWALGGAESALKPSSSSPAFQQPPPFSA